MRGPSRVLRINPACLRMRRCSDDLAAYSCLFTRQHAENAHSGGVTDGLGEFGEFLVGLGTFERANVGRGRGWLGTAEGLGFLDRDLSIDDRRIGGVGSSREHIAWGKPWYSHQI